MGAFYETRNYSSGVKVWQKSYENIHFIPHWHYEMEFIFILDGEAMIEVEGATVLATQGDLVICDSGQVHHSSSKYMNNHLEFLIFDPVIVYSGFVGFFLKSPIIESDVLKKHGLYEHLLSLLRGIKEENHKKELYFEEIISSNLKQFCLKLFRATATFDKRLSQNKNHEKISSFKTLLDFIEKNFQKEISLKDGAKIMNLNESYFSTLFKEYTGYNFTNYLNNIRVDNVIRDLLETQDHITEIAMNNGFTNIKSFNRTFKNIVGVTPSQIRKQKSVPTYNLANQKSSVKQCTDDNENKTLVTK